MISGTAAAAPIRHGRLAIRDGRHQAGVRSAIFMTRVLNIACIRKRPSPVTSATCRDWLPWSRFIQPAGSPGLDTLKRFTGSEIFGSNAKSDQFSIGQILSPCCLQAAKSEVAFGAAAGPGSDHRTI